VLALIELGRSLLLAAGQAPNQTRPAEHGSALSRQLAELHPTLLATAINDLPHIEHPQILAALDQTAEAIHEELAARREHPGQRCRSESAR
jgi:hypothetical protein